MVDANSFIAQRVVGISNGIRTDYNLRIGVPQRGENSWQCSVDIDGLLPKFATQSEAESALQAMTLALHLVGIVLLEALRQGTHLYIEDETEGLVEINEELVAHMVPTRLGP